MERRTYKTSLRAPASLREGLASLVVEREALRYLQAEPGGSADGLYRRKPGLLQSAPAVKERYRAAVESWRGRAEEAVEAALEANARAIAGFKGRSLTHDRASLVTRASIKSVSGTATPDPRDISLHDYCRLAGESLKMVCAHVDSIAREVVPLLPASEDELFAAAAANAASNGSGIAAGSLRKYPEKAIAHFLGRHGNIELTAFEQVAAMMAVYRDSCEKVRFTCSLLADDAGYDFGGVVPALLYTCTVPRHFTTYLAQAWHVEPGWVRNALVGWRRKVDGLLPVSCRVESLAGAFHELVGHAMALVGGDEAQVQVVGILERQRVLHLLDRDVNLSPLLPVGLHGALARLRAAARASDGWRGAAIASTGAHEACFSLPSLATAASELARSVQATAASFPAGSVPAINCRAFLAKVDAIVAMLPRVAPLLEHYLPGSRYTGAVAKMLAATGESKQRRVSRLFTALRGITTLAFAAANPAATAQLTSVLVPGNCVTRPFTSPRRKRRHLPLDLLFNKYVVIRKEHPAATRQVDGAAREAFLDNGAATAILRRGEPIWLGIPVYSPTQFDTATRHITGTRAGVFWFELVPTRPMIARLERGAWLESIRLEVPRGPSRKVVADVILACDDAAAFRRSSAFIGAMDAAFGATPFPRDDYMGADLNALGPNAIALGTSTATIDLHTGADVLGPVEAAAKRIHALRTGIARLQRVVDSMVARGADAGRQRAQLAMLHGRVGRLRADAERRVLMVYLHALHRSGAKHASWDAVSVSTRGTKGVLAIAVTAMPKRAGLLAEFEAWARDLVAAGLLPRFEGVTPLSPFTGRVCDECMARTGVLARTRKPGTPYHEFVCTSCGRVGNRHQVSARVAALLLKRGIERGAPAPTGTATPSRSPAGFL